MNRRLLLRVLGLSGLATLLGSQTAKAQPADTESDHACDPHCFQGAEAVARANIAETDHWKRRIHDWSNRTMVVTRCGQAGCEVSLRDNEWRYKQRMLSGDERQSFVLEYGRASTLLLSLEYPSGKIRGFIFNGRHDGWNLSLELR